MIFDKKPQSRNNKYYSLSTTKNTTVENAKYELYFYVILFIEFGISSYHKAHLRYILLDRNNDDIY